MFGTSKRPVQIVLVFLLTFAGTFWLLQGGPIPALVVKPLEVDPDLPVFRHKDLKAAEVPHKPASSGTRSNKRAGSLTCDPEARREFIAQIDRFASMRHLLAMKNQDMKKKYGGLRQDPVSEMEEALKELMESGVFAVDDFSGSTRDWVSTFAPAGSAVKARSRERC